jgi:hypothetical protein
LKARVVARVRMDGYKKNDNSEQPQLH